MVFVRKNFMRVSSFNSMHWVKIVLLFLLGFLIGYALALYLSQANNYMPLVSLVVSSVIGIGIPIWREYFVTKSKLTVEINSIERNIVDKVQIDLREYEDLNRLYVEFLDFSEPSNSTYSVSMRPPTAPVNVVRSLPPAVRSGTTVFSSSSNKYINPKDTGILENIEQLDSVFQYLKKQFDGLPQKIEQAKKYLFDLEGILPDDFTEKTARKFFSSVSPSIVSQYPIGFSFSDFLDPKTRDNAYAELVKHYKNELTFLEDRQKRLQPPYFNMQDAKETIDKIKKDLVENRSKFFISVSLVNSGRLNTSIKVPAILRVYIAKGTYVNLELQMYSGTSEVPPNSTKVVSFRSSEISQLPEDGRNLINSYWKNNVYCTLFLEDVRAEIYRSNPIVFSSGVYQKIIYDRLANAAANYNPWSDIR
jgi:hypothetical protein